MCSFKLVCKSVLARFLFLTLFCLTACKAKQCEDYEIFDFAISESKSFSSISDVFSKGLYIVPNSGDDNSFLLSLPEGIVYQNHKIYIVDSAFEKIVIYDDEGNPESCLNRRGNGPQEYLQISHFDVDDHGNIFVLDGRKDVLLKYSPELMFIESYVLDFQVNYISCLEDGNMLMALSPWDESSYRDKQVLLVDSSMSVISSMLDADDNRDPNFEFPSNGFVKAGSSIIYHVPVSDKVYQFSSLGELGNSYYFDFAGKSIPETYRSDIEKYYDELENYQTLVNSVYIDEDIVVGTVMSDGIFRDFIVNRKNDILYLSDDNFSDMHLIGISGNSAIYYIPAGGEVGNFMPHDVKSQYECGNDVLLILDLGLLRF